MSIHFGMLIKIDIGLQSILSTKKEKFGIFISVKEHMPRVRKSYNTFWVSKRVSLLKNERAPHQSKRKKHISEQLVVQISSQISLLRSFKTSGLWVENGTRQKNFSSLRKMQSCVSISPRKMFISSWEGNEKFR